MTESQPADDASDGPLTPGGAELSGVVRRPFTPRALVWNGEAFVDDVRAIEPALDILAADSWRSSHGAAAHFDLHCLRFEAGVARWALDAGLPIPSAREWASMRRAMIAAILTAHHDTHRDAGLETGQDLFPRIGWEMIGGHAGPVFVLRIRACPPMRDDTTLLWTGLTDPRLHPTVKGPDIERLGKLRGVAASRGCDDAILADPNRTVLEASTGSLVWWYEGKIVLPAHRERVLPGVTETMVARRAASLGMQVVRANARTDDWGSGQGVWFLNSVQGISPVTRVVIGSRAMHLAPFVATAEWRHWWGSQFRPYSPSL